MKNNSKNSNSGDSKPKAWFKKPWVIGLLSFVALVMIIFISSFVTQVNYYRQVIAQEEALKKIDLTKDMRNKPPVMINTENNFSIGADNPELTIVEFADFSCPYCKEMSFKIRNILKAYPNRVRMVFKDYPVVNEEGLTFAMAARCVGNKNETLFWMMHDDLFNLQGILDREELIGIAEAMGINKEEFTTCIDDQKYLDDIKKDAQEAENLGVEATPTLFLNGHMIPGNIPEEILFKAVQEFLDNK